MTSWWTGCSCSPLCVLYVEASAHSTFGSDRPARLMIVVMRVCRTQRCEPHNVIWRAIVSWNDGRSVFRSCCVGEADRTSLSSSSTTVVSEAGLTSLDCWVDNQHGWAAPRWDVRAARSQTAFWGKRWSPATAEHSSSSAIYHAQIGQPVTALYV